MGYFQVRYDSRVVIYDRRGFIRLATGVLIHRFTFFAMGSITILADLLFDWFRINQTSKCVLSQPNQCN